MRGLYCDGNGVAFRHDLPEPVPEPGELRLRVAAVGICDTDLQLARGYMAFQGILGHEFVAWTDDGRRVTGEINNSCHGCPVCLSGLPSHCPNRSVLGILNHDGAMADHVCVPARNLHTIPEKLSDEEAVFIEPLAAAFRVTEQVALGHGTRVAVVGDGKLGLLCTWAARQAAAGVTLFGKHPEKLALAGPDVSTIPLDSTRSLFHTFDIVIDCTGSPSGLPTALDLVRPCGTVVLKTTIAGSHSTSLAPVVIDEIRVIGSRCGPFPRAIQALERGEIDVRPLIGATYPLDQAEAAFQAAGAKGALKVVLKT